MNPETIPSFGDMMGQVFYSELAGHLFTARGTDRPDRTNDIFFAEERRQRLGYPKDSATESSDSSIDPQLPTFSHEEIMTGIETLRSQSMILLGHHFPSRGFSIVPRIAPLACLRLQPPDFELFQKRDMQRVTARKRLAYFQLMLLVAYDWWDIFSDRLDEFHEDLAASYSYRKDEASAWVRALSLACLKGHDNILRCLVRFFVPTAVDARGSRCQPKLLWFGNSRCSLLEAIARQGLGRPEHRGDSKLYLQPKILEQLDHTLPTRRSS